MPFSIQTNVNSLIAQENLRVNSNFQSQTIQRLTSGFRINQSGDDAAGLAIANKFRSDVSELSQGVRNANDGVSQLQIIDGGMNNISKMLDRLKTLATQSASDTFTGDRSALNSEYQTLVGEINRQAQSIGLNQGGSFARSLSIYLGGGAGSSDASILANGQVNVDLSQSIVDAGSLGLNGVQAVNPTLYDLSAASPTSVQAIVNDPTNKAALTSGSTLFNLTGPGFGDSNGIAITVNLSGVGDTNGLVAAIDAAIQAAASSPTSAASAFKAADISASVTTDEATGKQMLAFSSSNAAFQVKAGDLMANALMGNFGAAPTGAAIATNLAAAGNYAAGTALGAATTVTISGGGMATPFTQSFLAADTGATVLTALQGNLALQAANLTASIVGSKLTLTSKTGEAFTLTTTGDSGNALGFGAAGFNGSGQTAGAQATGFRAFIAGGSYELGTAGSPNTETDLGWTNLAGGEKQGITINANDASGGHPITVTLDGAAGTSIDYAIHAINAKLQQSNVPALQKITAIKTDAAGVQKINFISTLSSFAISVATSSAGNGVAGSGTSYEALQVGTGGAADISTATGAKAAVSAITSAVTLLGTAQAAVGKGQNQLSYAIGLANSQISNFSAAQAQIRDADVAAEAANLTKAQVLQQASMAAMAQANTAPQAVLSLLKG